MPQHGRHAIVARWRVMEGVMYVRNIEPSLGELLDDEAARLLMARDGLDAAAVHAFIQATVRRLELDDETATAELTHRAA
jgi:hypothetical protein